jgi:hypothetical protein
VYLDVKEKITMPMADFLNSLTDRTRKGIALHNEVVDSVIENTSILLCMAIARVIYLAFFIKLRVLSPINA